MKLPVNKIICGDYTEVMRKWSHGLLDAVVTDPPYGIGATQMTLGSRKKKFKKVSWDSDRPAVRHLLDRAPNVIIWGGNYFADQLPITNDWLCWHKKNDNLSFSEFELAWTNIGGNCRMLSHHWSGEVKIHPTQKPITVMRWCIGLIKPKPKIIVDPFCGSGTTCVAARSLGIDYIGIDRSEEYCDIARRRLKKKTKLPPTIEKEGFFK